MKTEYDFPVELMPMRTSKGGILVPDRVAVIRTDTKETLGIVSTKYQLFKHSDAIQGFREVLKGMDVTEKIAVTKNGAQLFASYKMNNVTMEVQKGDVVSLQFVVRNSYDGSNTLQLSLGAFRLVCSNGMVIGKRMSVYSQKHVGATVFNVQEFRDRIEVLKSQFEESLPLIQKMSRVTLSESNVALGFSKEFAALPEYLLDEARASYTAELDSSAWGYYNALTFAITHKMKHDNPQASIHFGKIAWQAAQKMV